MSRSQTAVELCALLVDETYGELTSRIFTTLLRKGRLPISTIAQHTRLPPRSVRHGIAVLIQQNLVYHCTEEDGVTHYEPRDDAAYALVRSGKIMDIVESRYGGHARDVVQNIFLLGHTKVSDLAEAYESQQQKQPTNGTSNGHPTVNGVNGHAKTNITTNGQLDRILIELLELGLIEPVVERMFRSPADTRLDVEKNVLKTYGPDGVKGKSIIEWQKGTDEAVINQESENREWRDKIRKRSNGVLTNGINGSGKRRRLSHGSSSVNGDHGYEDDGTRLDPDLVIRINHEKCAVLLRNFQLIEAVKDRIGGTTSQIYAELLRHLEKKIDKCHYPLDENNNTIDTPSVMTKDIASSLSKSVNVALGIGKITGGANKNGEMGNVMGSPESSKKRKAEDFEAKAEANDEDVSMVNGIIPEVEDDPFVDAPAVKAPKRQKVTFEENLPRADDFYTKDDRVLHVKEHLVLLENDQYGFVKKAGMGGHGEWAINFPKIVEHLKESEIDKLVFEMFGQTGRRLIRMLRKLGRLDEKTLKEGSLMKQKDVRTKLAELQLAGWIDIQEIPKDASRGINNARCIFLWFFDNERSSTLVLDHTYKAMSRLLQRLVVERRRAKSVLELTERSDIRDKPPEEYLSPLQLNELESFREKEDMLLGQLGRLDEIVGIFKDF